MAKLMTLVKSGSDTTPEEFARVWRDEFLPELLKLDGARGLQKVVHHHVIPSDIREGEGLPGNRWAGVATYYFDSQDQVDALLADQGFKALLDRFKSTLTEATHLPVDEVWMYNRDPSELPLKMFAFFKRKPEFTRAQSHEYYRTTHAEVGESINRNRTVRYIQNHVAVDYRNPDSQYDYDGGPEIWFKSMDVALDLFNDREAMETLGRDEENFVRRSELLHFLTDEQVVFERQTVPA